tara:strand:+ start:4010 stop:5065 length:1056 start_codon:yes stop_codon:yes gene_type:complete
MSNSSFFIKDREISKNFPPYIIAEISANHNGSINRAKDTIIAAKNAGVDAIKLQTYTPNTMTINVNRSDFFIKEGLWKNRSLYDLYSQAYTPYEWHSELFDFAKKNEITLFSTPFDETAVDLLDELNVPVFKVASFEIVDIPLIKYIASKNKPILISTGMASLKEIKNAIEISKTVGNNNIALFHCISSYPTPLSQANLNFISLLREKFNVQVGLSDHTIGNLASVLATAMGATIIEKHFTLSRSDGGVDSTFSLEPKEMKALVKQTKEAFSALGDTQFKRTKSEEHNRIFRRSIYFVKDVKRGEIFSESNIRRIRPGFGLDAKYYSEIIGLECKITAKRGDRLTKDHFKI